MERVELERRVYAQREELAENRELLRMALESASLGAWDYRLDTGEVFWDERCRGIFGVSSESRIDFRTLTSCVHADDRLAVDRAMGKAIIGRNGGVYHQEFRVVWQDGSVRWVSSHGKVYFDGGARRLIGANQDITARKQAEAYRELAREVLQILNEPGDVDGSIREVLAVIKKRTGVDAVGIRLQAGDDFPYFAQEGFPGDFLLTENELLSTGSSGGREKKRVELECTCGLVLSGRGGADDPFFTPGGSFWTNDSSLVLDIPPADDPRVRPRDGCVHRGYGSFALVPIRNKEKVMGLVQFNSRSKGRFSPEGIELLEGMVAHIGAALVRRRAEEEKVKLEAQLQQAQKLELVGQLAGGVAHDFNNKLCVILGHVNLALLDLDAAQPLHANMEEIRKAAEQSAELTRQLLTFARKQTVVPKVLDLNKTVSGICQMLKRLIGERIHLSWHPFEGLWPVRVDPSQIDQILTNLCVNARDAIADAGNIVIESENISVADNAFEPHSDLEPGEYVRLVVGDDGCGIDNSLQAHIFEPFFTTKGIGEGTGLGLSSVYGAVKQNNGFIAVYSEPGVGTRFSIYLPRHMGNIDAETEGAAAPVSRGRETILLVEDEQPILDMITAILARQGYTVLQASTPSRAIRIAKEYQGGIDLLVTDVVLPEMDGVELARNIDSIHENLKHLFMSGYPAAIIAHQGFIDEELHLISKPFSFSSLADKVREVLDGN